MPEITEFLSAIRSRRLEGRSPIVAIVYEELRKLTADKLGHEGAGCNRPRETSR